MRNLEILLNASSRLLELDQDVCEIVKWFTVDEMSHKLYLITSKNLLYAFSYSQLLPANSCKKLYQWEINSENNATPICMAYIQELNGLWIAYSSGSIIKHSNPGENEGNFF